MPLTMVLQNKKTTLQDRLKGIEECRFFFTHFVI